MTNMSCFECGLEKMEPSRLEILGERYGESFPVQVEGFRCSNCGFETVESSAAELTKHISDAYRAKHGLMTGAEIVSCREQLKMSQQEFADYIGVGVASVKRWELGKIQEKALDELMRLKTNPGAARENLKALEFKFPEAHLVSSAVVKGHDLCFSFNLDQQVYRKQNAMVAVELAPCSFGEFETPVAA